MLTSVLLITASLTNLVIGAMVLRHRRKHVTNLLFFLFVVFIVLYSSANFLIDFYAESPLLSLFWVRVTAFAMSCAPLIFLLFAYRFPVKIYPAPRLIAVTVISSAIIFSAISFTQIIVKDVDTEQYPVQVVQGPLYNIFLFYVAITFMCGLVVLIHKFRHIKESHKYQMKYFFFGSGLMIVVATITNIILPQFFGISTYVRLGPITPLFFVGFTAYAIVKYRLMDVKVAILKSLSLTALIGGVLGIYGLLVIFAVPVLSNAMEVPIEVLAGMAALISIPVARGIQYVLTQATSHFLFQNKVDYKKALADIGQELSATIYIEEVTKTVLHATQEIIRTRKSAILLYEPEKKVFKPRAQRGMDKLNISIQPDNVLISYLTNKQSIIVKEELDLEKEKLKDNDKIKEIGVIQDTLNWLDISAVVPLFVNKELSGMILLGDKLSGEPYLQDDTEFLAALSSQAAVALENARLYKESLEFGKKLEEEVDKATKELEGANIQLRSLDKAKSEFLSIASHQLRTPLTALRGYVSMMLEGDYGKIPDKQEPILQILDQSATRLIELINSLLDISRIESGRLELDLELVDLVEIAEGLVEELLPNARQKNLALEFHKPKKKISRAVVDKKRIRQVMLNFIDNAIKYTKEGKVDVHLGQDGDEIAFWVKDTGKGISKEDLARLFNKFTRVGGASRYNTEGTGLGLYVARQIVKEHKGEVSVDSEGEGKGSTFFMTLPAEESPRGLKIGEKAEVVIKAAEA